MASKINLIVNPNYAISGPKSYTHLMRKYRLHPTQNGPYSIGRTIHQTGRPFTTKPIGGRARFHDVIHKHLPGSELQQCETDDFQNDAVFFVPVDIGSPPQNVQLVLDSASADFWVRSLAEGNRGFDSAKSSTFAPFEDATWKVSRIDGSSVSGSFGTDEITIGGVTSKEQTVQLADAVSPAFARASGDGVLGLSFGSISTLTPKVKTLADRLTADHDIASSDKLFTVKLGSWGDNELEQPFCTLGYIDQETVRSCGNGVKYTSVDNERGYWMLDSVSLTIGEQTVDRPDNKAVVDTDAALTLLDDRACQAIYDSVPGAYYDVDSQGYLVPAEIDVDALPELKLAVGGDLFRVPKQSLLFGEAKAGHVYGGVQSRGSLEFDVFGKPFLDGVYVIFDVGATRLGIAQPSL
ncbi:aspartic peptidase domain-containing protein [Aspergillus avenaceus]|uniref:Aspartic peptidase domain-containing protein n=1 Tax=Aspergillus avenaceus TaxID=36643 RepID=A0A5N6TRT1_ASPAV|nr:aspartic peptidase domain-containing protein [Aspergillus avenaceus]